MRRRFRGEGIFYVILLVCYLAFTYDPEEGNRRPSPNTPSPEEQAEAPPAPRRSGPLPSLGSVTVEIPALRQSGSGTAFSLDSDGVWVTARHVIDACDRVGIQTRRNNAIPAKKVTMHPDADMAVIETEWAGPDIGFSQATMATGSEGFHVGYPRGVPGDVHSRLIGRSTLKTVGRYQLREPVLVWAEGQRFPDFSGSLGGLSGGPVFNASGSVVGVTVAESARRGRIISTDPNNFRPMWRRARVVPVSAPDTKESFDLKTLPDVGHDLRSTLTVARVICLVEPGKPRRR